MRKITRREGIILAGIGALGITGIFAVTAKPEKITFQEARENPELRQEYLEQFKHLFDKPYVSEVVYEETQPENTKIGARVGGYNLGEMGNREAYKVEVYPFAFKGEPIKTEADFLSTLVDHEIEGHARIFYYGLKEMPESAFRGTNGRYHGAQIDAYEAFACQNQFMSPRIRSCSKEYGFGVLSQFHEYYSNLLSASKNFPFENPAAFEKAQTFFFKTTMLTARINGKEMILNKDGHLHWLVNNEGKRVHMPESLCEKYGR